MLKWNSWDYTFDFDISDATERRRVTNVIGQKVALTNGEAAGAAYQQAAVEAMDNSWKHGYAGNTGKLIVRFREEPDRFRIQIEDFGKNGVKEAQVNADRSGFAVMKAGCSNIDVRKGSESGTVVELILEKPIANNLKNK
jgi:anti-sigma regulatory factor (Ser/Thr protein kinase)